MTSRDLELNLRAKADTKDLKKLASETADLVAALRRTDEAFSETNDAAKNLASTYGALSTAEQKQIKNAAAISAALDRAAVARERSAQAALGTASAEARAATAQQQSEQAAIRTAAAQERLHQVQERTTQVISRTAVAEEKLAQERQRSFQSTQKIEKGEYDIARSRENARKAALQAEAAELRLARARTTSGNSLAASVQNIQRLLTGGALILAAQQMLRFGEAIKEAASAGAELDVLEGRFGNLAKSIGSSGQELRIALREATGGMVSDAELMASASDLISFGLGRNAAEVSDMANLITKLGLDIEVFNLTLSNNSKMRLDALGLSVEAVTKRSKELQDAGVDFDKAFDQAVIEGLRARLELLGDQSTTTAGQIAAMEATATNVSNAFKQAFAVSMTDAIKIARGEVDNLDKALIEAATHYGDLVGDVLSSAALQGIGLELQRQISDAGGDLTKLQAELLAAQNLGATGIINYGDVEIQAEAVRLLSDELENLNRVNATPTERRASEGWIQTSRQIIDVTERQVEATKRLIESRRDLRNATTPQDMRDYAAAIRQGLEDEEKAQRQRDEQLARSVAIDERKAASLAAYQEELARYQQAAAEGGAFFYEQVESDAPIFSTAMVTNGQALNEVIVAIGQSSGVTAPQAAELAVAMGEMSPAMAEAAVKAAVLQSAIAILFDQWQAGILPDAGALLENIDAVILELQNKDLPTIELELQAKSITFADEMDPGEIRALAVDGESVDIPISPVKANTWDSALSDALQGITGAPTEQRTLEILANTQAVLDATTTDIPGYITAMPEDARTVDFLADVSSVDAAVEGLPDLIEIPVTFVVTGDPIAGMGIPGRATGGPVYSGLPYIVGEQGPELFVPGTSGRIVPNGQGMGGAFPQTFEINQYFYGPAQPDKVREAVAGAQDVFLSQYRRRGGVA